jgi:hypothetical protein
MQISPSGSLKTPEIAIYIFKPLEVHFYEFLKGLCIKKNLSKRVYWLLIAYFNFFMSFWGEFQHV